MDERDTNTVSHEPRPRDILCVYSQADESFYLQLKKSLNLWERRGHLRWLELRPGDELLATWQNNVKCSDLILLLLSPDFFPDELCYQTMYIALRERVARQVPVVPILVRAVNWRLSACKDLAIVPHNEQPIASWTLRDEAYVSIVADLARLLPAWQLPLPTRPGLFQARDLPKDYVPRLKTFNEIKHQLLRRQSKATTAITTALRGAGGFGKTTLALALCHDPEIQSVFPDGILWVELGEQPPRPLDLLNGVLYSLQPSLSGAITLEEAQNRWLTVLHERRYLLVIDDVWQAVALEPLLDGGSQCVRLVTTRNDQVLPEHTMRIWVDAMDQEEAITTLCKGLPDEIQQLEYRPALEALVTRLNCWPLLLTLARGMLLSQVRYGRALTPALQVIEQAYEARGVIAFDLNNENERQRAAGACLEASLSHLEEFTSRRYHAVERYQELAIFPEDIDIPLIILQRFWKGARGLEAWETEDLCMRLHQLSLLLTCDLGTGTIRLHDVMRSYLVQRADSHLPALHEHFLDVSKLVLGLKRWADLPASDTYLWQHLILHLCRTGRREALFAQLTDLMYLIRKVLYVGVAALEDDLRMACTHEEKKAMTDASSPFESLHRTIVRISHLLRQVATEAEIGGLLLSHLGSQSPFAPQREVWESELLRPFFATRHPLLGRSSFALIRTLHGHTDSVKSCAVSPDGRWIISASRDGTLKVWDAATGSERFTLQGHTKAVSSCAVSPDGRFIVSASDDQTLKVWDAATGSERLTLQGHTNTVSGCAVSPDGRFIVSASADQTLKVWDAVTGSERLTLQGHTNWVYGCTVSPDSHFIVSASEDKTLKVWDAATGSERLTLQGHTNWVIDCAVSPDGCFIVSASRDGTLKVWDAATGSERLTLQGHTNTVSGCAVSPDNRFIVSASNDQTLKVWDAATGGERLTLFGHTFAVFCCVVSPDSRFIVSASADKTLKVWDAATGGERLILQGHTNWVSNCAVSLDGRFIVSASRDKTLKVWDAATGSERLTLQGHTKAVSGCTVSPNGRFIVSASEDKTLKVWDAATGSECFTLQGHTKAVSSCAVSPNGRFIVSASEDKTLKVWDAATGSERLTLQGHTKAVSSCAVSPDGRFIVSASDDQTLKVWDAATGSERLTLQGHTNTVSGCAVSPNGRFIVSASADQTLKVWDAATGGERLILQGHTNWVSNCAVSPDGRFIVSVSWDGTLRAWNAQTGQRLLTFPVDEVFSDCVFHPNGEHLVACGRRGVYFLRLVT